jgi:L-threonylcarbamoyladenylate synthase
MTLIKTRLLTPDEPGAIREASRILQSGGLVAFPTETVYGLGGDALSPEAAAKIYAAKGRPSDNPLIVHIAEPGDVKRLAREIPSAAGTLLHAFWPGPLTMILPKKSSVPDATTGGLDTVAIRMPAHPAALRLIRESGILIAAPSANLSGRPSPTDAEHVREDLSGRIDMILDGGPVGIGIESTIIDLTGDKPTILRPGFITKDMLEAMIGPVEIDPSLIHPDPNLRPRAPGMKYTHYAPKGNLTIIEDAEKPDQVTPAVAERIRKLADEAVSAGKHTVILTTEDHRSLYNGYPLILLGEKRNGRTVAAHLYGALRECDAAGAEIILSESFRADELGGAIMNRLLKAAGHDLVSV